MDYLRKLSIATLGLKTDDIREATKKGGKAIARFYGTASTIEYGAGDNGPWVKFKGQIEAVNLITGTVARSGSMFLPSVVSDVLEGQLAGAKQDDPNGSVQFAFEIGVKKSDTPIGYEYVGGSLIKETESDVLAKLRSTLPEKPVLTMS